MADGVQVTVDTRRAQLKIERITPGVRNQLRVVLPKLIRQLAALVSGRIDSELKSRKSLTIAQEIHDISNKQIFGVVRLESSANPLLPKWLEEGTHAHPIVGNPILAFPWDFMGAYGGSVSPHTTMAFFRSVKHPGTRAYKFLENSLDEMRADIIAELEAAAKLGARQGG